MHSAVGDRELMAEEPAPKPMALVRKNGAKLLKASFGVAVVGAGLWSLLRAFAFSVSTQAVIAGSVTQLSAPIGGNLHLQSLSVGQFVDAGQLLSNIVDSRADSSVVEDLEGRLRATEASLATIAPLIEELGKAADTFQRGSNSYQSRRVVQLRLQVKETEARLERARAQAAEAAERRRRTVELAANGLAGTETVTSVQRDSIVAEQDAVASQLALEGVRTQLDSARAGVITDGLGADRPYSGQRLDEVRLEQARWRQRFDELERVRDSLRAQLEQARARLKRTSDAELRAHKRSRVWQLSALEQSYVSQGQPVVSLMACDSLSIVAIVGERVFNRLRIGGKATFKLAGSKEAYRAEIVQLKGVAPTDYSDVIVSPGLKVTPGENPYRVILASTELSKAQAEGCALGHSGEVRFDD
jgi:multidrug resistance efflux pump